SGLQAGADGAGVPGAAVDGIAPGRGASAVPVYCRYGPHRHVVGLEDGGLRRAGRPLQRRRLPDLLLLPNVRHAGDLGLRVGHDHHPRRGRSADDAVVGPLRVPVAGAGDGLDGPGECRMSRGAGIVVQGVSKVYRLPGGKADRPALHDVNLTVAPGEFVGLLGPSGCGKTTLLNIISGLDSDYSGTVRFTAPDGAASFRPVIGYVFQEARLLPWLTVRDNLRLVLPARGKETERDARIEAWLARVGLEGYGDYFPGQLSVGMQQRVAVARALMIEPDVLVMDEPF